MGEETSAILRRAVAAAEEIVADANTQAKQLAARVEDETRQSREEADRYREQAALDADKIESQANSKAAQAEAAAQQAREEASRYAERIKDEAEEVLAQASADAEQLAHERHRLSEDLHNLADDFRRTSDALASGSDPDDHTKAPTATAPLAGDGVSYAARTMRFLACGPVARLRESFKTRSGRAGQTSSATPHSRTSSLSTSRPVPAGRLLFA
ncbi:MAG: hypothetical protein ACR2ND_05045 [Solirubrobacteraceae bacterium]